MRDLTPLLRPRSIAMIGASSDPGRGNGRAFRYLIEGGFKGPVYPINPKRSEVQGHRCWSSILELPQSVDLVILALPAEMVADSLRDCVSAGVKAAIVFASGYAETGPAGALAQDELTKIAKAGGLLLLGPNSLGAYDARSRSYMTFSSMFEEGYATGGRIGMVTQSGGWGSQARRVAVERGLSIVQWVSVGNECDVDTAEVLHSMALDSDIDVILLYLEGVKDGRKLLTALEAARCANKVVATIKVGRTLKGREAAASHTAALTGEDEVFDEVCRAFGVHRADSIEELLDVAYAAQIAKDHNRLPADDTAVILTPSGGFGVHMTDQSVLQGLSLPAPDPHAQQQLTALFPSAILHNPVDLTGQVLNQIPDFGDALEILLESETYQGAQVFVGIAGSAPALRKRWYDALCQVAKKIPNKWLGLSIMAPADLITQYEAAGFTVFEDTSRLIRAHAALVRANRAFRRTTIEPQTFDVTLPAGRFTETGAKTLLRNIGIGSPREALCKDAQHAAAFARTLGKPVVVKVVSAQIQHKTEVGGVVLGLSQPQEVIRAVEGLQARVNEHRPDAVVEGYLVAEMIDEGMDCLLGLRHDPDYGPVVVFGAGGVMTEWLRDFSMRLAPIDSDGARSMINETKISAALQGWRGSAPLDLPALVDAICRISHLGSVLGDCDIEINPLRVLPEGRGVLALDALITKASP